MSRMPVIAIVGRPNVGKSSLLNALVRKRISIVQDMPGVTRDRVVTEYQIDGRWVEIVDTGGYGHVDVDHLTDHIKHQIEIAMARADLVVFVVDCAAGLTGGDEAIATLLRRQGIRTLLIANKCDGDRMDAALGEFARLGLGTPVGVSALHGRNVEGVIDAIRPMIDLANAPTELPEPQMRVAIVGKRNAGKSTLVNAIAKFYEGDTERVIVSEVPGTTRDSIDVRFEKDGKTLIVIDTAGVRKKRHMVTNDIEFYSYHRAQRSVRRADVVMLLIDAAEPISEPDKKLAQYIAEQYKPVLFVVNKWDCAKDILRQKKKLGDTEIVDDRALMEKYRTYIDEEIGYLDFAPIVFTSARDGRNVQAALDAAQHLFNQARQRMTTGRLNQAVRDILRERQPSNRLGRKAKVFYTTQIDVLPPTIVLVVNNPEFFDEGYKRFALNRMRDLLPYPEVPIRLLLNARSQKSQEKSLEEIENDEELEVEREAPTSRPVEFKAPGAGSRRPAVKGTKKRQGTARGAKQAKRGGGKAAPRGYQKPRGARPRPVKKTPGPRH